VRIRDLYKTEIYDERRETALPPLLLLYVTLTYIITVVSFDRYQTLRIVPLAAYPIFVGLFFWRIMQGSAQKNDSSNAFCDPDRDMESVF